MMARSDLSQNQEQARYKLDSKQEAWLAGGESEKNISQKTSAAYFETGKDYTVDLRQSGEHHVRSREEIRPDARFNQVEDFEKDAYMASVFEWAATAIENLVVGYKGQEEATSLSKDSLSKDSLPSDIETRIYEASAQKFHQMAKGFRQRAEELKEKGEQALAMHREMKNPYGKWLTRQTMSVKENTMVQAEGMVVTEDGRTIDFTMNLAMGRKKTESSESAWEVVKPVDPLVINFSGTPPALDRGKMEFDLDGDGIDEKISRLNSGSGFLALDLNKDGKINNGLELFGPASSNGFKDLALYDSDQNQWIDENDPIFEDLRVWIQDEEEGNVLKNLSELGIGAIHLSGVASDFLIEDPAGRGGARVVSTGLALMEDGKAASVQQLDFFA